MDETTGYFFLIFGALVSFTTVVQAECEHEWCDNTWRTAYEKISGDNNNHYKVTWMTCTCLDCGKVWPGERWVTNEEAHTFSGSRW